MSIEKFHEWAGFYADRITGWMSVDELKDGCGRLLTADAGSPELLLIHAMHQVTAQAAELEALRAENAKLRTVMIAAAEEISEHWDAHCNAEGYGPVNLMHRLEHGIPSEYGYTAGAFYELRTRLEAAELDAALWAASLKHQWDSVGIADVVCPPGQPGSYARGYHNGFCEALQAIKATRDAAMQPKEQQAQKGEGV